jgi:hypothetical protein
LFHFCSFPHFPTNQTYSKEQKEKEKEKEKNTLKSALGSRENTLKRALGSREGAMGSGFFSQ